MEFSYSSNHALFPKSAKKDLSFPSQFIEYHPSLIVICHDCSNSYLLLFSSLSLLLIILTTIYKLTLPKLYFFNSGTYKKYIYMKQPPASKFFVYSRTVLQNFFLCADKKAKGFRILIMQGKKKERTHLLTKLRLL